MHSVPAPLNPGDRAIRIAAAATVTAVAGIAAVISYTHTRDLAAAHGQSGLAAQLLPVSVDGLILAASLVMLQEARARRPTPALARWMLGLGVAATLAANVAYGARYGLAGAVISAWPAVAFIGGAELLMGMIRRARAYSVSEPDIPAAAPRSGVIPNGGPVIAPELAEAFAGELAAGRVPPIRRIRDELRCGQDRAREVQAHLRALAAAR